MINSENLETLKSYIIACCADGKISAQEYNYLKKESKKCKLSENKLKKEIYITLLNIGKDKKGKKDFKSCVIYTKEALKFDPDNKEILNILNEAVDALSENELLDLARTTINGFEVYKEILFEKIKEKGNDYYSKTISEKEDSSENKEKAVNLFTVASKIKPNEQDTIIKLNQLIDDSDFVYTDDKPDGPSIHPKFKDVKLFKKGGMALIYTAILNDPNSRWHERKIIIKQIKPDKKDEVIYKKLFYKEYNILRYFEHENILGIIRKGENEHGQYYISEFINGKNLNELIEENIGLTKKDGKRKRISQILKGLLNGIQGIHEESIIHRDIKPANTMITNTANKVKIIDFGLAKTDVYNDKFKEVGTRPYNSPEQRQYAHKVDNRTDIYSFGVVMLELIAGWKEKEYANKLPERLSNLKRIINKCTQDETNNRYNYISEIIEEFSKKEVQYELKLCGEKTIDEIEKESATAPPAPELSAKRKYNPKKLIITCLIIISAILTGFVVYKFFPLSIDKVSSKLKAKPEKIVLNNDTSQSVSIDIESNFTGIAETKDDLIILNKHKGNKNDLTDISTNTPDNSVNSREGTIIINETNEWTFNDLVAYIEEIRGTSASIDFDKLFEYIDPNCEVFYYINNQKLSSSENITTFINKIKFGATEKIVVNSLKYNSQRKIIEFCQE